MARKAATTAQDRPLHVALLDGFEVKSRDDGSVHTIRAGKSVVAEVCVGKRATRLNLRSAPKPAPKNVKLGGKSKTWAGGGVIVSDENVTALRLILAAAVKSAAAA